MMTDTLMRPFGVDIDLIEGAMDQPDTHLVRKASDMKGYYSNPRASLS